MRAQYPPAVHYIFLNEKLSFSFIPRFVWNLSNPSYQISSNREAPCVLRLPHTFHPLRYT
jgi:hypothetical protein